MTETTIYDEVGGLGFFEDLVARFYEGVEPDELLRPLYPVDLEPGKRALALFLAQYWGGPTIYSDEKGHPRLRVRHATFEIGDAERAAWLGHMTEALTSFSLDASAEKKMLDYFVMAAQHMVNDA